MTINTFRDWWVSNSEELFARTKDPKKGELNVWGDWWSEFQKCWDAAQNLELQRCAKLSAHRLSWEAQVAKAEADGCLRKFLDERKEGPPNE
jgi:hypothetical protein